MHINSQIFLDEEVHFIYQILTEMQAAEFELSTNAAEQALRQNGGDCVATMQALLA